LVLHSLCSTRSRCVWRARQPVLGLPSLAERRRPVCLSSDNSSSLCPTHSLLPTAPVPPLALLFGLHSPIFPIVSASHHAYSLRSLWGAMSLRHGCFFSTSAVAIVPPPGHRQGLAPRLGAPCTPEAVAHGSAGRHGEDDLVFLTRQHTMALPVSAAWPGHRPLLHGAASAGRGGIPSSPNHRSRPVFFTPPPVPIVVGGSAIALLWSLSSDLRATQCGAPSKPQPTTWNGRSGIWRHNYSVRMACPTAKTTRTKLTRPSPRLVYHCNDAIPQIQEGPRPWCTQARSLSAPNGADSSDRPRRPRLSVSALRRGVLRRFSLDQSHVRIVLLVYPCVSSNMIGWRSPLLP